MKFVNTATIAADRAKVWALLMDLPRVAACVPGVEQVSAAGEGRCRGVLKVSVGPIRLALAGDVALRDRDDMAGVATLHVDAADDRAGGAVRADVRLSVRDGDSPRTTGLTIETDANVMGRIGEFGQPLIKRKADQTIAEFAANLGRAASEVSGAG